jgi:hypothetical protein
MTIKFNEKYSAAQQEQITSFYSRLSEKPVARSANSFSARKVDTTSEGNVYEFIGVSEGIKRDGSTIHIPGIDLRGLKANPVFLFGHDYSKPPIGRIVDFKRAKLKDSSRALAIRVAPNKSQVDSEHKRFADMIFDMIDKGDMRTVSFGWATVEAQPLKDTEGYFTGWNFLKSDGLEFSAVPVPADPTALLTTARSFGFDENILDRFVLRSEKNSPYVLREVEEQQEFEVEEDEVKIDIENITRDVPADAKPADVIESVLARVQALVDKLTGVEETITNLNTRKGAVLNAANRKALVDAATLIATVLKNASVQESDSEKPATAAAEDVVVTQTPSETTREQEAQNFEDIQAWIEKKKLDSAARLILGQMAQRAKVSPK